MNPRRLYLLRTVPLVSVLVLLSCAGAMRIPEAVGQIRIRFAVDEVRADSNGEVRLPLLIINEGTEKADLPMFDSLFLIWMDPLDADVDKNVPKQGHIDGRHKAKVILRAKDTLGIVLTFLETAFPAELVNGRHEYAVSYDCAYKISGRVVRWWFQTPELALVSGTSTDSHSETTAGSIRGIVVDRESGKPVTGMVVTVKGTTISVLTKARGYFEVSGLEPGTYTLVLIHADYTTLECRDVVVETNKSSKLRLMMYKKEPPI
ncbi:MAG: carboxypeptidase regulatory-like domain-containing protein [Candidatus Zixiibacteriota bacterium]